MTRPIPAIRFGRDAVVPAPASGVQVGVGDAGPLSLRLFRLVGTRLAVVGLVEAAQLIAIRAAGAGTPVQVVTARPQLWEPLLRHSHTSRVTGGDDLPPPPGGPSLVVDDRPGPARANPDRIPWRCVLGVRAQWGGDDLASFAYNDLTIFGAVPVQLVSAVTSVFGLSQQSGDRLAYVPSGSVAVLRRGGVDVVGLNPTSAEYQLVEATRTAPQGPAAPIWRS